MAGCTNIVFFSNETQIAFLQQAVMYIVTAHPDNKNLNNDFIYIFLTQLSLDIKNSKALTFHLPEQFDNVAVLIHADVSRHMNVKLNLCHNEFC